MSLVTTPGASNADSFASVAEADSYFSSRGVATWVGTTSDKEIALRRATDYFENQYRNRWIGARATQAQALSWPRLAGNFRYGRVDVLYDIDGFPIASNIVPDQVKRATFEAALLVLTGIDLQPRLTPEDYAEEIDVTVGSISKNIRYGNAAPAINRYTVIEGLLRGLVISTPGATSGTVSLVRA